MWCQKCFGFLFIYFYCVILMNIVALSCRLSLNWHMTNLFFFLSFFFFYFRLFRFVKDKNAFQVPESHDVFLILHSPVKLAKKKMPKVKLGKIEKSEKRINELDQTRNTMNFLWDVWLSLVRKRNKKYLGKYKSHHKHRHTSKSTFMFPYEWSVKIFIYDMLEMFYLRKDFIIPLIN